MAEPHKLIAPKPVELPKQQIANRFKTDFDGLYLELLSVCELCTWLGFTEDFEHHNPRTEKYPGYMQPVCAYPGDIPIHIGYLLGSKWNEKRNCWESQLFEEPRICMKFKKSTRTKLEVPPEPVFKCCKCGKVFEDREARYHRPGGDVCMDCA